MVAGNKENHSAIAHCCKYGYKCSKKVIAKILLKSIPKRSENDTFESVKIESVRIDRPSQ